MQDCRELNIESEIFREYHYSDGKVLHIDNPKRLFITPQGSHRIVTEDGRTFRPETGYVGISWKPKDGAPAFVA